MDSGKIFLAMSATRTFSTQSHLKQDGRLDVIYVDTCLVVEFNSIVAQFSFQLICIVDLDSIRKLTVSFQITCLLRCVLDNDVAFLILKISQRHKNDVALVYPHFFPHLSSNVAQTLNTIKASDLT